MTHPSPPPPTDVGALSRPAPETPPPSTRAVTAVIAVLAFSAFVMILNETVLSVALPPLMTEFGVGATTVQWLTTGFLLTMAVVIPTTGFLLQRYSLRRLFLVAIALFLVGTALAAVAPSFGVMLAARVIQAGGTAIIMPLLMSSTLTLVPPRHRGAVMGVNAIVISVGPAIGPTLSGVVIEALGWRWVFGLMVPVALLALAVGLLLMPRLGGGRRVPLDVFSVLLSLAGFGGIITAISTAADLAQGSLVPPVALGVGVVAIAVFILRQRALLREDRAPLLDLTPFRERSFRLSVVLVMVAMGTMLGTVVVLPIYAQTGLGMSVLATGLMLLPGGVLQGVLSPLVGRAYDLWGPRPLVIPGSLLLSGSLWWMSTLGSTTPVLTIVAMHTVFSTGMALLLTPMMSHALGELPPRLYGHGTAIFTTLQQLAGAAGTAALIGALALGAAWSGETGAAAQIAGTRVAFIVGGSLALIGVLCAPFLGRTARSEAEGAA